MDRRVHMFQAGLIRIFPFLRWFPIRAEAAALASIYQRIHDTSFDAKLCPLKPLDLSGRAQTLVAHIVVLK